MSHDRIHFAPPVDGFIALGGESPEDFFCPDRLATWSRAEILPSRVGDLVARVPLPGTRDEDGRAYERPRGAGTGYVILRLYRTSFGNGMRARLSHPRSLSLAEREWNLSCQLREAGVGTADLMMAVARGTGFYSKLSVLVVRELTGMLTLDRWMQDPDLSTEERELGLESLSGAFDRLERSQIVLPELKPEDIFVSKRAELKKSCGLKENEDQAPAPIRRLPGVVFANLRGGFRATNPRDKRASATASELRNLVSNLPARVS
ncbi:MAG: hypothetical protein ACI8TQ_001063 [Planctomycetota bacterium]|jgi:hypothetical protein